MFESIALSVLERVLGQCTLPRVVGETLDFATPMSPQSCLLSDVENIDRNSLKVAVWRGHITLERLKLRREALYAWGLPLDIKAG